MFEPILGNPGIPNMPPSIDHLTKNVNKMTVQDGLNYERPSFPTQIMVRTVLSRNTT